MVEKIEQGVNWEVFIKTLLKRLDIPTKKDIQFLHDRLDTLEQLLYKKQPVSGKKKPAQDSTKKSASAVVLDIIANHPEGTDFKTIKAATGYDDKKLRNIIFRLDNIKKITRVARGIYKKV
ncbi:MAG: phasin family protein [Proteobacteria bacterium]|nr:phasin family protein [Pseudomonadota bacterium]MBU1386272.1 phasin family protein [Pseudomonadota bacterium]MBU1542964.1 phasin family protein [Pseudomonadota bacterium]MBU2479987.1 phasin family protein [Pseudomonadota bacterium]